MVRVVKTESWMASTILLRSEEIRVILATSIARSLPCPMAMLRSACANAELSLMPSPTIATHFPSACNCLIVSALCWGSISARYSLIPACSAMAFAVTGLSPVNISTVMPRFCNASIAVFEVGLMRSAIANTPKAVSASANQMTVLASDANVLAWSCSPAGILMWFSLSRRRFPA